MTDTSKFLPESLDGASLDVAETNRARLRSLFPSVFTEIRDEKGNLVESVDFEKLKAEIGTFTDLFEARRERYGMDWPGKKDTLKAIQSPTYATLKPAKDESVDWDTTENLFIEGDNLEVLKLLQKSYYGKVKMIYIDPPYNTGNEFIYPDNYSESLETYLAFSSLADTAGKRYVTNASSEGRFHTKWLNMMLPRLYLARNLLSDDGAIFVSIDDNEASNLRKLMDEIFGEENFIANINWKHTQQSKNDEKYFSRHHNSILAYKKSENLPPFFFDRTEEDNKAYSNPDNDPKGPWRSGDVRSPSYRETLRYKIETPNGVGIEPPENGWRWKNSVVLEKIATGEIFFSEDQKRIIRKIYLLEQEGRTPENVWSGEFAGTTRIANTELKELFDDPPFDTPKPTLLIGRLIELAARDKKSIVLDFFAGSGTTAHSVMLKNKEDNGHRKFILVQLPEICEENSAAHQANLRTIADITKERIRRAAAKLTEEDGNAKNQDRGFRAFTLDKSNFRRWQKLNPDTSAEKIAEQLELHVEHVDPSASQEDLLFEILIKAGFRPTEKAELVQMAGLPVYSVADGALLICLADRVTKELVESVAEAEPMNFFCLDSAFGGNDQLKANAVQTFAARNQGRDKAAQIVFRTV